MTTIAKQTNKKSPWRQRAPWIIAAALILAVAGTFAAQRLIGRTDPLGGGQAVNVTGGTLTAGISAIGQIEPLRQTDLAFPSQSGLVAEVLVEAGDTVKAGQPLVRLDDRDLVVQLAAADAALQVASADLSRVREGATPAEIAQAKAQVAQADGALTQTLGSVTDADLRATRAAIDEARARLATLQGSPNADTLIGARAALNETQATLTRQRASLSAAKLEAERAVSVAANALRDAQTAYAAARDNLTRVQADGKDPLTGAALTDAGERSYADAYARSQLAMQDADAALAQTRVSYESAKQQEIAGIAEAEARVSTAQANVEALLRPNADAVAAARAQLASAEAAGAKLLGTQRSGALAAQQAGLDAAKANLERVTADPRASDLARAQALVAQAAAQRDLAKIRLDGATLTAPFAGTVAAVNVTAGEIIGGAAPISLIDISRYKVNVVVDEVDVAKIAVGQRVDVLIDAIGAPALAGTVRRISPQALTGRSVTSYAVEVEVDPAGRAVRAGMTASATVVVGEDKNVVSVPLQAIRSEKSGSVVSVVTKGSDGSLSVATRQVTTGATYGDRVAVTAGLKAGEQVLLPK